jgi:hypothetical protein
MARFCQAFTYCDLLELFHAKTSVILNGHLFIATEEAIDRKMLSAN